MYVVLLVFGLSLDKYVGRGCQSHGCFLPYLLDQIYATNCVTLEMTVRKSAQWIRMVWILFESQKFPEMRKREFSTIISNEEPCVASMLYNFNFPFFLGDGL